jgi:hypothetical protein
MVGLEIGGWPGKPLKPKAARLIRSRSAEALASARTNCSPRTERASAWAFSRVARASATEGLSARAWRMVASSSGEPKACHQGPAARASGLSRTPGAAGSPAMA